MCQAPDRKAAERHLAEFVERFEKTAPQAVQCLEAGFEEALAVLALPEKYRKRLRSTNMQERLNEEIRRRERVIRIFPNDASALLRIPVPFGHPQGRGAMLGPSAYDRPFFRSARPRLVEDLNRRPFTKLPGCRRSAFEAQDRPALKVLPAVPSPGWLARCQDNKDPLPHGGLGVEVPQSAQELRDVVVRFGIEDEVGNVRLAELPLDFDDVAHGIFV